MPSGVDNAVRWKLSYISAQAAAVLGVGAEPPPDSSEPRRYVARSDCGLSALRSAWVIWPTLSSRDIRESRSLTRAGTGSDGSWYGSGAAVAVAGAAAWAVTSVVTANAAVPTAAARRRNSARWPGCRLIAATPQGEDTSSDTRCATTPRLARRAEGWRDPCGRRSRPDARQSVARLAPIVKSWNHTSLWRAVAFTS